MRHVSFICLFAAVDGGGMDDLVALFEEDDDIDDSDIEMNSEDEFEKLLDDGGKEQHADKKPTKMETKSDQSGSFEAIKGKLVVFNIFC